MLPKVVLASLGGFGLLGPQDWGSVFYYVFVSVLLWKSA